MSSQSTTGDWPDRLAERALAREPDHLHFDRAARRWLIHTHEGGLRPYGDEAMASQAPDRREA